MVDANSACWSATFWPLMQIDHSDRSADRSFRAFMLAALLLLRSGMAFGGFG